MSLNSDLMEGLTGQMADMSMLVVVMLVVLSMTIVLVTIRTLFGMSNTEKYMHQNRRNMDRVNDTIRDVKDGMHKAELEDRKRMEEIKLMLSASSLFDGSKSQKLVDELKELENKRKYHGIDIVIKNRPEDEYREHKSIIDGDKDDDSLVSMK